MCHNKDLGIYDLTWIEVADILNDELDEDYTDSKYRKRYKDMQRGIDMVSKKMADAEGLLENIEIKKLELKEERVRLSSLRNDVNKKVANRGRFKQWIDEVKESIEKVSVKVPTYKGISNGEYDKDYMLVISDIHTGRKGQSIDNYYSLDVLQDRMWQIRDEVIQIIKENQIKTLRVLSLGDLIDGFLRASQLQNLQIHRAQQTVFVARFLFEWLNSISEYCHIDFKMTTSANHSQSRPINSQRGDFDEDDYEIIIYEWLKDLCMQNPRISIEGNNILEFNILGRDCVAMHGHQLPRGNKQNPLKEVSFHMNKHYQYIFIGHLHHTEIKTVGKNKLGNKEVVYCPSICGNDDYSDSLWTGASAGSLFMEFNRKQGRRSVTDIVLN